MAIVISNDVFCDYCGTWEHGCTSSKQRFRLARKVVKKKGWKTIIVDGKLKDVCPQCLNDIDALVHENHE